MEMIAAIDLRAGHAFKYNDSVWQVLEQDFMKPGKGNAVMRVRMKDLRSGSIINTTLNPNNKYEKCMIDKKICYSLISMVIHMYSWIMKLMKQ